MTRASETFDLLSRALAPPAGDPGAFPPLGVPRPDPRALASEHVRLFGRAGAALLSPYEAGHRGTGLATIVRSFAERGFASDPSFRDRPDHVSVALAVMASLCRDAEQALGDGDRARGRDAAARARAFFAERVAPWVPALFERMARAEGFPLHRALARRGGRHLRGETGGGAGRRPAGDHAAAGTAREAACAVCGGPLGYSLPSGMGFRPPRDPVCAGCRLRADLRRLKS